MNCALCGAPPPLKTDPSFEQLCERCKSEKDEAERVSNGKVTDRVHKDRSVLCTKCGLCCFMLSAHITEEELERACADWNVGPNRLSMIAKDGPNEGKRVIKTPCVMLHGRVLNQVWCRAYTKFRPEVCPNYLCKIAVRFGLGLISLHEALFWLRTAYLRNDVTIFNWCKSDEEDKLIMSESLAQFVNDLRRHGVSEQRINLVLADSVTSPYTISGNKAHQLELGMIFDVHDRGDNDPSVYLGKEEFEQLDAAEKALAERVVRSVLNRLRPCFVKGESEFERMIRAARKVRDGRGTGEDQEEPGRVAQGPDVGDHAGPGQDGQDLRAQAGPAPGRDAEDVPGGLGPGPGQGGAEGEDAGEAGRGTAG